MPARSGWRAVVESAAAGAARDDCLGLAAQLAFYFLLSLFPGLLFLVSLIGYLPAENTVAIMLDALAAVAPRDVVSLVTTQLHDIASQDRVGLMTVAMAGALWSGSAAMVATIDALNHAYVVGEWRPWWKRRLVAIGLTTALSMFMVIALASVLLGPDIASSVARWFGVEPVFATLWTIVRWPVMLGLIVLGVDLVYHFAPNRRARWEWISPGALLATGVWVVGSFAFKFYLAHAAAFNATYGTIGGVVTLLLWLYVCGLAVLAGAELNGAIEQSARRSLANGRR